MKPATIAPRLTKRANTWGVNSGSKMRLKGRGLPCKVPGDFYVKLKIVIPKNLSAKEEALYQSLKALVTTHDQHESKSTKEKVDV